MKQVKQIKKLLGLKLKGWLLGDNGHLAEMRFDNGAEVYLNCETSIEPMQEDLIAAMRALENAEIFDSSFDGEKTYKLVFSKNGETITLGLLDRQDDIFCGFIYEE